MTPNGRFGTERWGNDRFGGRRWGQAGGWSPDDEAGLIFWYDSTEVEIAGGAVDVLTDLSGNGNDAQAPGPVNRPSDAVNTLNGLKVITFDGADDYLIPPQLTGEFDNGLSLFMVLRFHDGRPGSYNMPSGARSDATTDNVFQLLVVRNVDPTPGAFTCSVRDGAVGSISGQFTVFNDGLTPWCRIGAVITPNINMLLYFDDNAPVDVDISALTWADITKDAITERPYVGAWNKNGSDVNNMDGDMASFFMYNKPLTSSGVSKSMNYLKARYAL